MAKKVSLGDSTYYQGTTGLFIRYTCPSCAEPMLLEAAAPNYATTCTGCGEILLVSEDV